MMSPLWWWWWWWWLTIHRFRMMMTNRETGGFQSGYGCFFWALHIYVIIPIILSSSLLIYRIISHRGVGMAQNQKNNSIIHASGNKSGHGWVDHLFCLFSTYRKCHKSPPAAHPIQFWAPCYINNAIQLTPSRYKRDQKKKKGKEGNDTLTVPNTICLLSVF
jgi:hypothetical protein